MRRTNLISLALTTSLAILAGCSSHASGATNAESALRAAVAEGTTPVQATEQHVEHERLPFSLFGLHFDGHSRAAITAGLEKVGLQPAKPRNRWCDRFHQGRAAARLPGVGMIQVCYMSMIVLFDGAPSRLFEGIPSSHSHTL